jgi:hypothetical protein
VYLGNLCAIIQAIKAGIKIIKTKFLIKKTSTKNKKIIKSLFKKKSWFYIKKYRW